MNPLHRQGATGLGHEDAVVFGTPCSVPTSYNGKRCGENWKSHRKPLAGLWQREAISEN